MGKVEMLFSASWGECAILMDWEEVEKFNMKCIVWEEEINELFNSQKVKMIYEREYKDWGFQYWEKIQELTEYVVEVEKQHEEMERIQAIVYDKKIKEARNEEKSELKAMLKEENIERAKNRGTMKEVEISWLYFEIRTAWYLQKNKGLDFKNIKLEKNAIEVEPWLYLAHKDIIDTFKSLIK